MVLSGDKRKKFTQDYNIFNNLKCPALLGSPSKVSVKTVIHNTGANLVNYAAAYPVSGVSTQQRYGATQATANGPFYKGPDYAMGSNYFVPIGKCAAAPRSKDGCAGKTRWVYVRNIPTGKIPLFGNVNFKGVMGCNIPGVTEGRGLIPGMLEDLSDIQPFNLLDNAQGGGNYGDMACKKVALPVGSHIYDPKMKCSDPTFRSCDNSSWWIEEKCSPSYKYTKEVQPALPRIPAARPIGGKKEHFTNGLSSTKKRKPRRHLNLFALIILLLCSIGCVVALVYFGRK